MADEHGPIVRVGGVSKSFGEVLALASVSLEFEIFGPATVIHTVDSTDAAIDLANDTEYGLTGGVNCQDLNKALDVVARVRSGIIHINDQGIGDEPMAPVGDVKNSGYGKFGGTAGIASFTEQRWVTIQHRGRPNYPFQKRMLPTSS